MNRTDTKIKQKQNPIETASFLSKVSFWWLKDFLRLGITGGIVQDEIYAARKSLESDTLTNSFAICWQEELKQKNPSVLRFLFKKYGLRALLGGFVFSLIESIMRLLQPLCLGGLVSYFVPGQTEYTKNDAYLFAFGIIISQIVSVVAFHPFILYIFELGCRMRLGCSGLIYRKVLSLPKSALHEGLNGKVINLLSNDLARFELALAFIHDIWKGPLEAILFAYFIYKEIGISAIIGIVFLLSFIPLQAYIGKKAAQLRLKTAKRTDYRVKIMNEIILGIQVIKMYTWEKSFADLVNKIRKKEISCVRSTAYIRATLFSFGMVARISIFLSLISYIYFGNYITARKVFIVSSFFGILNYSMVYFWPVAITSVAEGYISVRRVQEFLLTSEEKPKEIKDWLITGEKKNQQQNENGDLGGEINSNKHKEYKRKNLVNEIIDKKMNSAIEVNKLIKQGRIENVTSNKPKEIHMENVTALWAASETGHGAGLNNVTLKIKQNELCVLIGQVGAGKTTLLQVILNELSVDNGLIDINGQISYAAQEPWLFEGTVKNNIIFIEEFNERRYKEVIKVCALERDFKLLPNGDLTIVGERGISLSGGQKARVNLARAIYKEADIYLLDDPLSAVDTHVGKHIFNECIKEYLKNKICVLVTHQLQYLKDEKHLVIMSNGRIDAQGSYFDLHKLKIDSLLMTQTPDDGDKENDKKKLDRQRSTSLSSVGSIFDEDNLDRKEHQQIGSVSFKVYKSYMKSVHNQCYLIFIIVMFILAQIGVSGVDFFIAQWVNWEQSLTISNQLELIDRSNDDINNGTNILNNTQNIENSTNLIDAADDDRTQEFEERQKYIIFYAVLMGIASYIYIHRTFAFFSMCVKASVNLHDQIFRGISRVSMFFFNNNPSGRILNRFSKDITSVDNLLPPAMMDCLSCLLEFIAIVILVMIVNYWLIIPTMVMAFLFYIIRYIFINTARSVKRIESITLSPIYSHTNATLQGLSTIRAFKANKILESEFYNHLDANSGLWYMRTTTTRWFALWLDIVCLLYITTVTLSFVFIDVSSSKSGNVGMAILQTINMIGMCQWGMRQTAEIENQMTSVERIIEYAELPSEPPLETSPEYQPTKEWPQYGAISLKNLNFKYSENADYVLKNITIDILAKEKIGIVGRTGAGKSSIIQALFRLAKLDGIIEIDGINTNTLGLHDLRNKISIIPQDPVLFSGTLRFNLDPFDECSDEQLWMALDEVELKTVVIGLAGGLDCRMSDGGSNFSMGQRQLVCLARAILRNNRILILDEATANVDPETDRLIQTTIRDKFYDCTVLTIAHRLHTVMDSDRVLVIDAGFAVEFDHPYELLQKTNGFLRQLVDQTGLETALVLTQAAEKNYYQLKSQEHNKTE